MRSVLPVVSSAMLRMLWSLPYLIVALTLGCACSAESYLQATRGSRGLSSNISQRSPRATITGFFEAAREGRFRDASIFLELPEGISTSNAAAVAFRLRAVLDRHLWFDLEMLSSATEGKLDDELDPRLENIGRIEQSYRAPLVIYLARAPEGAPVGWRFSSLTVHALEERYEGIPDHELLERFPPWLMRMGWGQLMWWQWMALPAVCAVAILLGLLLGWLTQLVLSRFARRARLLVARTRGPLSASWTLAILYAWSRHLMLSLPAEIAVQSMLNTGLLVVVFWGLLRAIDLGADLVESSSTLNNSSTRGFLPMLTRVAKFAVLSLLVITVLSSFGIPVTSLLAGLGVGGVALALAAQKTVENVFGAVSIGVDVPFRVGDTIKLDSTIGTVESIGLRSTRVRTLDRTVLTIPNGSLADSRIESYSARDGTRLRTSIGVEYGTTAAALKAILHDVSTYLRGHGRIDATSVVVRFASFGAYALEVDIIATFMTPDFAEFQELREEVLLEIMAIAERYDVAFAFPTQTLHLKGSQPPGHG